MPEDEMTMHDAATILGNSKVESNPDHETISKAAAILGRHRFSNKGLLRIHQSNGGIYRAMKLSPERRREIARRAAMGREIKRLRVMTEEEREVYFIKHPQNECLRKFL